MRRWRSNKSSPDVVVMDIAMPELDGIQATRLIRAECPRTKVLILTMHESDAYFFRALEAGATGYVLKKGAGDELIDALRAVARGQTFFHASMARKLLDSLALPGRAGLGSGQGDAALSDREWEIMLLIVQGVSSHEIADTLELGPPAPCRPIGRTSCANWAWQPRWNMVRYAIRRGLIEA